MIVFKYFLRLVWRYRIMIIIYAAIFMTMAALTTKNQASDNSAVSDTSLRIGVSMTDSSPLAQGFVTYLSENNSVTVSQDTETTLKEKVYTGEFDGAVILPTNLEDIIKQQTDSIQTITSPTNADGVLFKEQVNQYFTFAHALLQTDHFSSEQLNQIKAKHASLTLISTNDAPQASGVWAATFYEASAFVLILTLIGLLGLILSEFEEPNVSARQRISATSLLRLNEEKFMGAVCLAGVIVVLLTLMAIAFQPSSVTSASFYQHTIILSIHALAILSLAYLCTTLIGNRKSLYSIISTVLGVGLTMLSGGNIPITYLSDTVISVAKCFPVFYAVQAHESVAQQQAFGGNLIVLSLFALTYFLIALTVQKIKQAR